MGKKLIVKGADFSANGIIVGELTFINDYSDSVLRASEILESANTFYIMESELTRLGLSDKTVSYVKMYSPIAGTVQIGTVNSTGTTISGNQNYLVNAGVNTIKLQTPITIDSSHLPCFTGQGILVFWNDNDDNKGWKLLRANSSSTYPNNRMPISFGYIADPEE